MSVRYACIATVVSLPTAAIATTAKQTNASCTTQKDEVNADLLAFLKA